MNDNENSILYSGRLGIDYGQFYVDTKVIDEEEYLVPDKAFSNQTNGICGAAQPGKLFLVVGPQMGCIHIEVSLHDAEPEPDESFEEIVEASITVGEDQIYLCEWGHEATYPLKILPGRYRVRYCIRGMERDYGEDDDWESPIEGQSHKIQFWPSEIDGERVVKVTSEVAKYWHREWGSH